MKTMIDIILNLYVSLNKDCIPPAMGGLSEIPCWEYAARHVMQPTYQEK